jgi:hypothetical protein
MYNKISLVKEKMTFLSPSYNSEIKQKICFSFSRPHIMKLNCGKTAETVSDVFHDDLACQSSKTVLAASANQRAAALAIAVHDKWGKNHRQRHMQCQLRLYLS